MKGMLHSSATQNMNIIHISKQAQDCPDVCYSESSRKKKKEKKQHTHNKTGIFFLVKKTGSDSYKEVP